MSKSKAENFSLTAPVVLIGMMGAGKTSVGRALAKLAQAPFFDADREIEKAAGLTVAEIFTRYGEEEFRRLEREVIARLLASDEACVLSLGGGAFMNKETRSRIKQGAFSIWLKVDRVLLVERVTRNNDRPLLQGGDPAEKLAAILSEREPVYTLADLTVECDKRPVSQTARRVRDALTAHISKSKID